jgi:hypothetical protein
MSGPACGAPDAKPIAQPLEVNAAFADLGAMIGHLTEAVAELRDRLVPVTKQVPHENCKEAESASEYNCPLATSIEYEMGRLVDLRDMVRVQLKLLEI